MANTIIRQLQGQPMAEAMYWLLTYSLRPSPPLPDKDDWIQRVTARQGATALVLEENGKSVACVAGIGMTQNVRNKLYSMGGIWGVATHPAARRKGYSKRLLSQLFAALRDQGCAFSCLYPFRESFYQRMGYINFPLTIKARFQTAALQPLLQQDLHGEIETFANNEGYHHYLAFLDILRQRVHGMAMFDSPDQHQAQRNDLWLALTRINGEAVGLMLYDLRGEGATLYKLQAIRFYYLTSQGKYLLLQWIARHIDQAHQVELWLPPSAYPETWLTDLNVAIESSIRSAMGRVLDIARLSGMQAGTGEFTVRIQDPLCPWNEDIWRFQGQDGRLQVSAAQNANCELSIQGLSALVYGSHSPEDFNLRGWGTPSPQVQEQMQAVFPPRVPYLHESF